MSLCRRLPSDEDEANYHHLSGGNSFSGSNGSITAKTVTLAPQAASRVYNGATGYTATEADLAYLSGLLGASGNWFDPANWAGGAVPDRANVAQVVIPANVTVSFDTTGAVAPAYASAAVQVDSLGTAGSLSQSNGTLNVGAGGITLAQLTQTSGSLSIGGNASLTDTSGGLQLGNLSTMGNVTASSTGGAITQAGGTALTVRGNSSFAASNGAVPADIILDNAGNDFTGTVDVSGATGSVRDANGLALGLVTTTGNLTLQSDGALDLGTSSVGGALNANSGNGNITQAGALRVAGLPAWLRFDAAKLRFEASAVPDGGFPLQLTVVVGGRTATVVISERSS